jgi:hypothetical protein
MDRHLAAKVIGVSQKKSRQFMLPLVSELASGLEAVDEWMRAE